MLTGARRVAPLSNRLRSHGFEAIGSNPPRGLGWSRARFHSGPRLRGFGGFGSLGCPKLFGFFRGYSVGFLFLGAALLLFDLPQLRFLALPSFFDLTLAPLYILAFARFKERARARIHLARGKLAQNLMRTLIPLALLRRGLLEGAVLLFRRLRLLLMYRFLTKAMSRALAFRLDENGFGAAMAEVLANMALLHCSLHVQGHGLPASRLIVRFFRFRHTLPWHGRSFRRAIAA
jgi:hypothetical protein